MPPKHKPRVLLITRNLPPLIGGMERLLLSAATGIADYAELTVIGPRGCREHLPPQVEVCEVPSGLSPFLAAASWQIVRLATRHSWDATVGGSGLTAPLLLFARTLLRCPTMVLLHGLDIVIDRRLYQAFFLPCIRRVDRVIANSNNTRELAQGRGVAAERIVVVNPGTSLPPQPGQAARAEFRARHDIPFTHYLLFVGRLTKRKGLSRFLRRCLPQILAQRPGCGLVVVGESPAHSLNRLGEEAEVMSAITEGNLDDRVRFLGKLSEDDLLTCYADAAVQVFPLVDVPGDVEGFGMVAVEAAACGTPTVAFRLGGVADAVSCANGHLIQPSDHEAFASKVVDTLRTGTPDAASCRNFAREFAWENYHARLRDILEPLSGTGRGAKLEDG